MSADAHRRADVLVHRLFYFRKVVAENCNIALGLLGMLRLRLCKKRCGVRSNEDQISSAKPKLPKLKLKLTCLKPVSIHSFYRIICPPATPRPQRHLRKPHHE